MIDFPRRVNDRDLETVFDYAPAGRWDHDA